MGTSVDVTDGTDFIGKGATPDLAERDAMDAYDSWEPPGQKPPATPCLFIMKWTALEDRLPRTAAARKKSLTLDSTESWQRVMQGVLSEIGGIDEQKKYALECSYIAHCASSE
ncbi:hypothetical protein CMO91_02520 [Candidatus Woesearchaeota archaeon]|nr:hypothetical protein [Candidatus Woesearchaeota archaeon]|tara:strand:- start:7 stop:345 length:339 start_codon:yes stop_codon:yes gene_type:complete